MFHLKVESEGCQTHNILLPLNHLPPYLQFELISATFRINFLPSAICPDIKSPHYLSP